MIKVLAEDRVFLNYGPMQMMIMASCKERKLTSDLQAAAGYAISHLSDLAQVLNKAKDVRSIEEPCPVKSPLVLELMIEAVKASGDQTLTPMAAVAGTFSDLVADFLVDRGAAKVMVNNGGDIAIRLENGEQTKIGLTPSINAPSFTHVILLTAEDRIGGVATSGLGGRSFTKGIASAVTVLAENARIADSCATVIANHCFAEDPGIIQMAAEKLDPNTDIPGQLVTVKVESLKPETKLQALAKGLQKAAELKARGVIYGAAIFLDDLFQTLPTGLGYAVNSEGGK